MSRDTAGERVIGTTTWSYSFGYHDLFPPCGCKGYYFSHEVGLPGSGLYTWYDALCECMNCGAVWFHSDWIGEEDPQYELA